MLSDVTTDDPTIARLTQVRGLLSKATTVTDAMIALSGADLVTLRLLEADYFHHPGPASALRDRIARAHADYVREFESQRNNTGQVTPQVVARWAGDTLAEWMRGYTDFDPDLGGQYRIAVQDHCASTVVIDVETSMGFDRRRFRLTVAAEEVV